MVEREIHSRTEEEKAFSTLQKQKFPIKLFSPQLTALVLVAERPIAGIFPWFLRAGLWTHHVVCRSAGLQKRSWKMKRSFQAAVSTRPISLLPGVLNLHLLTEEGRMEGRSKITERRNVRSVSLHERYCLILNCQSLIPMYRETSTTHFAAPKLEDFSD